MEKSDRIYIAGHRGLVGSAIVRKLKESGYSNLVFQPKSELDLLNQSAVNHFFESQSIDYVFLAAARVGGIHANDTHSADFLYENLMIAANVLHAAAQTNVKKLLYLGSSCIYPRMAPQPIQESSLMSGPLELTNEGYAVAKIAGLKLCEMYRRQYQKDFIAVMPTNLYGPGDNFHPTDSHVIPGMMGRFHAAKMDRLSEVKIWGTGSPKREFLYVDDLADALVLLMQIYSESQFINVGTGEDCSILNLAELMSSTVGFQGRIATDPTKPDGTPRKVLDVSRIKKLGWSPKTSLQEGLKKTYQWAVEAGKL